MRWILYQLQRVEVQYQVQHRVLSRPGEIDRSNTTINFRGCWTKAANAAQLAEPHDEPHSKQCVDTPVQQLAEPRAERQVDLSGKQHVKQHEELFSEIIREGARTRATASIAMRRRRAGGGMEGAGQVDDEYYY